MNGIYPNDLKNREFFEVGTSRFELGVAEGERYWTLGELEVNLKMEC